MSFQKPIGPEPPDPYERYRAERNEADRRTKNEERERREEEKTSSTALGAYLLIIFHKFLDFFFSHAFKKTIPISSESDACKNLLLIKAAFETMKREDRSEDPSFLNRLSELWHNLLENSLNLEKDAPFFKDLKELIKDVDTYSENSEFPFGYYLSEYAGQHWLPFPYMDLVKRLHNQHQKNPESSALSRWVDMINILLEKIKSL